jgi:hypothetical protein
LRALDASPSDAWRAEVTLGVGAESSCDETRRPIVYYYMKRWLPRRNELRPIIKLLRFFISTGILPGLAAVAGAQGRLTLPHSWESQARGQRPVAVPNGKIVYVDEPSVFVARNGPRQLNLHALTTLSMEDTARLSADARPVAAAFDDLARRLDVRVINVQFENAKETVAVGGTMRPLVWVATFVRAANGRWVVQKLPRRSIQLDVRP